MPYQVRTRPIVFLGLLALAISVVVPSTVLATGILAPLQQSNDGRIAFMSTRKGSADVFAVDSSGRRLSRITTSSVPDDDPAWSADGTRLAYSSKRNGNPEIYVVKNVGERRPVTTRITRNSARDEDPAWSPDGRRIAFTSTRKVRPQIYVISSTPARRPRPVPLTRDRANNQHPAWAPSGSQIAYTSDRDRNDEVYVMDTRGRRQRNLTRNRADDMQPAWSPDGRRIAFASDRAGIFDIWVMDANGSRQRRVTRLSGAETHPSWSPDGQRIVYQYRSRRRTDLVVINANGSGAPTRLAGSRSTDGSPNWGPSLEDASAPAASGTGSPNAPDACTTQWAAPVNGLFGDAKRWTSGVPDKNDHACLGVTGADYTVVVGAGVSIGGLTLFSSNTTVRAQPGAAITVQAPATARGTTVSIDSGVLDLKSAPLQMQGGAFDVVRGDVRGRVVLTGVSIKVGRNATGPDGYVLSGISNFDADIKTGQVVDIQARLAQPTVISAQGGLTNAGEINFKTDTNGGSGNIALLVSGGPIDNKGVLRSVAGSGAITIGADIENTGRFIVDAPGTIVSSRTLTNQEGGSIELSEEGRLEVRDGGAFRYEAGLIDSAIGASNPLSDARNFVTIIDSTLHLAPESANGGPEFLDGRVIFLVGGSSTLTSDIQVGQTVRIEGGLSGPAVLTASSLVNHGGIRLEDSVFADSDTDVATLAATLVVTNGPLDNRGTLRVQNSTRGRLVGTPPEPMSVETDIQNRGTISLAHPLVISGRTVTQLEGGSIRLFGNDGRLEVRDGGTFRYEAGLIETSLGGTNFTAVRNVVTIIDSTLHLAPESANGGPEFLDGRVIFLVGGSSTLTSDIQEGQTVRIEGGLFGPAVLTSATGFRNNGNIILTDTPLEDRDPDSATLAVPNGVVDNQGLLRAQKAARTRVVGDPPELVRVRAEVTNNDRISIAAVTVLFDGQALTNGASGVIDGTGRLQLGPSTTFTNNGAIEGSVEVETT